MQLEIIQDTLNKYIDSDLLDVAGLFDAIKYKTTIYLNDIQRFVKKVNVPFIKRKYGWHVRENPYYSLYNALGDETIDIETFIRRVPFYFYIYSNKERELSSDFYKLWASSSNAKVDEDKFYVILENLYYTFHLNLETIFGYVLNQFGSLDDFNNYFLWYEYASFIYQSGDMDYCPKNVLWAYNSALTNKAKRYSIDSWHRTDREIVVSGNLPFDPETKELNMSWILLWVNNYKSIVVEPLDSNDLRVNIHIELEPNTFIYQYIDGVWEQLYVGPEEMYFDLDAIKQRRKELKYTQDEVANIIGVSYRSYQYFEQGRYDPNGLQLIRLMNLLNFNDFEALIYKENIEDKNLDRYLSGKPIKEFLKARY